MFFLSQQKNKCVQGTLLSWGSFGRFEIRAILTACDPMCDASHQKCSEFGQNVQLSPRNDQNPSFRRTAAWSLSSYHCRWLYRVSFSWRGVPWVDSRACGFRGGHVKATFFVNLNKHPNHRFVPFWVGFERTKSSRTKAAVHRYCCARTMLLHGSCKRRLAESPGSEDPWRFTAEALSWRTLCEPIFADRRGKTVFSMHTRAHSVCHDTYCSLLR